MRRHGRSAGSAATGSASVHMPFCAHYPKLEISLTILPVDDVLNEVAGSRAHNRLAFNPPPHERVEYRANCAQAVVLRVTVPIDRARFPGTNARVLVKSGQPLVAAAHELPAWILQRMTMFAAGHGGSDGS